jgi:uncharacterized protein YjiK
MVLLSVSCRPAQNPEAAARDAAEGNARAARLEATLAHPDSGANGADPLARWILPPALREISGLALTSDGRLFTHGDEQGEVWEVDYRKGQLIKKFVLGTPVVKADFEGITTVGDVFFLMASDGTLYEFHEGANEARVAYQVHDPGLGKVCEFEGVAFDAAINSLLLVCKNVKTKSLVDSLVIYRWKLAKGNAKASEPLTVPLARAIGGNGWKQLHPSDITVDPQTGNYVIIASPEKALIVLTPGGDVVISRPLPGSNAQPEGVAITRDGVLILSDEARRGAATITLFRWSGT